MIENIGLVYHVANKYTRILAQEEAVAEGSLGLVAAAHAYDFERGNKFSTFAIWRIRGAILDSIRRRSPLSRSQAAAGVEAPVITTLESEEMSEDHRPFLADTDPLPDEQLEAKEIKRAVYEAMRRLTEREEALVKGTFIDGNPLHAIAKRLGISESRAAQIRTKALGKLRVELAVLA